MEASDPIKIICRKHLQMGAVHIWDKANDRLMWDKTVSTPVGLIVHGAREVNNFLADGQYFFVDILREGIVLYELDDRPLAEPRPRTPADAFRFAKEYFDDRLPQAKTFADGAEIFASRGDSRKQPFCCISQ